MTHSFSNCPLRSSSLLITHHVTQAIIAVTDEVSDLLGYSNKMSSRLLGQTIHTLQLQLVFTNTNSTTSIPECTIPHVNGDLIYFQLCIHKDPLGGSSCLDYWLIRPYHRDNSDNSNAGSSSQRLFQQTTATTASVLRLSPYGTIEQAQPSPWFKQNVSELVGRPVMAFVYQDDVKPLCSNLANLCSIQHNNLQQQKSAAIVNPLFIRWSGFPKLYSTNLLDHEEGLNYDCMSFQMMVNHSNNSIGMVGNLVRPICILKPLQIISIEEKEKQQKAFSSACTMSNKELTIQLLQHYASLFRQLLEYCESLCGKSKTYLNEFYQHIVSTIVEMSSELTSILHQQIPYSATTALHAIIDDSVQQQLTSSSLPSANDFMWDLIKSNYILKCSLNMLEFTGLFGQQSHYFKTCINS